MLISSMGRYAVLILLDLAEHRGGFVPVRQIAERQELSQKYLERILRTLTESRDWSKERTAKAAATA